MSIKINQEIKLIIHYIDETISSLISLEFAFTYSKANTLKRLWDYAVNGNRNHFWSVFNDKGLVMERQVKINDKPTLNVQSDAIRAEVFI